MKMRYFAILLLSAVLLTGCGGGTSTKNGTTAVATTTENKGKTDLVDLMSTQDYSCTVDSSLFESFVCFLEKHNILLTIYCVSHADYFLSLFRRF